MPRTIPQRAPRQSITSPLTVQVVSSFSARSTAGLADPAGAMRRLQALAWLGWTRQQLASRLGMSRAQLRRLYAGEGPCTLDERRRVVEVYEQLWDQVPPDTWDARSARGDARFRGWYPAAAWDDDDNDDPAAQPQLPTSGRRRPVLEDLAWMAGAGESVAGAAARLGMEPASIYKLLSRHHRLDLWAALTAGRAA